LVIITAKVRQHQKLFLSLARFRSGKLLWAAEAKRISAKPIDLTYTQLKVTISAIIPFRKMYTSLRLRAQRQKRYRCQNRRKNYNTFKTRKGTVYDGGGILPDLQLEESKLSTITTH
jgi:carboxyl-terminal processing protease